MNWAIQTQVDSKIVGYVQATVDKATHHAEIAYMLGRSAWRHGFASESVATMLAFLGTCGVTQVDATVDERNAPSIRLLERLAFGLSNADDRHNLRYRRVTV